MFKELEPILKKRALIITAAHTDSGIRVTVHSKEKDDKRAFPTLALVGTAEELDGPQFAEALENFADRVKSFGESMDDVDRQLKELEDEARKKLEEKKKSAKSGKNKPAAAKDADKGGGKKVIEPPQAEEPETAEEPAPVERNTASPQTEPQLPFLT